MSIATEGGRTSVVVVDSGAGNLRSIKRMLERLDAEAVVTSDPAAVIDARALVLPGVGHFGQAMANLEQSGLIDPLNAKVLDEQVPILGICLGMQLFLDGSEEGGASGLGWVAGEAVRFDAARANTEIKVPHMGWNTLALQNREPLLSHTSPDDAFYFVHSYHAVCSSSRDVVAITEYGYEFPSVVRKRNVVGTQFHPEKSHDQGQRILAAFLESCRCFDPA